METRNIAVYLSFWAKYFPSAELKTGFSVALAALFATTGTSNLRANAHAKRAPGWPGLASGREKNGKSALFEIKIKGGFSF